MAAPIQIPDEHIDCIQALIDFIESDSKESAAFENLSDGQIEAVLKSAIKVFKSRERKINLPFRKIVSDYYDENQDVFGTDVFGRYQHQIHQSFGSPREEDISEIVRWRYPESGSQSNEGDRLRKQLEVACAKDNIRNITL